MLSLDIVLFEDETVEDAVKVVAGKWLPLLQWEEVYSGNGHPQINFTGPENILAKVKMRYNHLGDNVGRKKHNKGRPPVAKGEKRV